MKPRNIKANLLYLIVILLKSFSHPKNLSTPTYLSTLFLTNHLLISTVSYTPSAFTSRGLVFSLPLPFVSFVEILS
jgi:hypothetical protein